MSAPAFHTLDIYDVELHLASTAGQWKKLRKHLDFLAETAPTAQGQATFATWTPREGAATPVVVLWVNATAHHSQPELIDTCAHEATHAAQLILEFIGHQPQGVDEPSAYLIGWLTRWMVRHLKAHA